MGVVAGKHLQGPWNKSGQAGAAVAFGAAASCPSEGQRARGAALMELPMLLMKRTGQLFNSGQALRMGCSWALGGDGGRRFISGLCFLCTRLLGVASTPPGIESTV